MVDSLKINMVTTWNKRCGIAYYAKFLARELNKFVKVNIIPIERDKPSLKDIGYFILLASVAKRNCDLVHIQHEYALFGGRILNRYFNGLMHIPFFARLIFPKKPIVITTIHELRRKGRTSKIGKMWYMLIDKILFQCSDILIVHTKWAKKELIRKGAAKEKLRVIPHGSCNPTLLSKKRCKIRLGLLGHKVLTIFGFVCREKGHDLLIEIMPKLRNFVLLIAGAPRIEEAYQYYEKLRRRVDELGLNEKVKFLGFVPDDEVATVINASDLVVLPYRHVTQSGVLGIVLPYKVPVIASDLDFFKEIKNSYDCILLFKRDDKTDLLKKINFLFTRSEYKSKLIANMEKFWRETNWYNVARKTYKVYALVTSKQKIECKRLRR